jgi:hypothetical protein
MVLKEKVLQLEKKEDPNLKVAKLIGYETVQADAGASGDAEDDIILEEGTSVVREDLVERV